MSAREQSFFKVLRQAPAPLWFFMYGCVAWIGIGLLRALGDPELAGLEGWVRTFFFILGLVIAVVGTIGLASEVVFLCLSKRQEKHFSSDVERFLKSWRPPRER